MIGCGWAGVHGFADASAPIPTQLMLAGGLFSGYVCLNSCGTSGLVSMWRHIETRPLVPQEFKQTYPENKPPASISWVGIGALASAKPWTPAQPQPIIPATTSPAQATLAPSNVVEEHAEPTPVPAIPQSNGTGSPTP